MTDKRKKFRVILLAVGLLLLGIIGMTAAYLTDSETKSNVVTLGKIDLELKEIFQTETVVPGQIVNKQPFLQSTGRHDEYVFLEITVPKYDLQMLFEQDEYITESDGKFTLYSCKNGDTTEYYINADSDPDTYYKAEETIDGNYTKSETETDVTSLTLTEKGKLNLHEKGTKKGTQSPQEIFRIIANENDIDEDGELITTDENGTAISLSVERALLKNDDDTIKEKTDFLYHNGDNNTEGWVFLGLSSDTSTERVYVFGYNRKLKAKDGDTTDKTVTIFNQIQLKSFIDEDFQKINTTGIASIGVDAYGIQADNLDLDELPTSGNLSEANLQAIYTVINNKLGR